MSNLRMFLPITKVDAAQRLVYGIATGEAEDRSGEICDYASTKPFYQKWSGEIAKSTDGKSLGNVRAMHGKVAAGKVTALSFNDDAKQIEICAKVVDDAEWNKVQEGVYTGFSQGGEYVKRWKDEATGLQRYTASPSEVSLVDLPCLSTATFQIIKAAGAAPETRAFKSVVESPMPTNAEISAKANELAKAAGKEGEWASYIETARETLVKAALPAPPEAPRSAEEPAPAGATPPVPGDGLEQVWKAKDGTTFVKKADAVAHNAEIDAKAATDPATKAVTDKLDEIAGKLGIEKTAAAAGDQQDGTKAPATAADPATNGVTAADNAKRKKRVGLTGQPMKAANANDLAKSLWNAAQLAAILGDLKGIMSSAEWDSIYAGDEPTDSAAAFRPWIIDGCRLLGQMIQEECADMSEGLEDDADVVVLEMAAGKLKPGVATMLGKTFAEIKPLKKVGEHLAKAGARNSKADADKIQAMHDTSVDLGATCAGEDDAGKAHGHGDLTKALAAMTTDRDVAKARGDALQKAIDERIMPTLDTILKRVANIEAQPLPLPFSGTPRAVSKGSEDGGPTDVAGHLAQLKRDDPEAFGLLMIKLAQSQPQHMQLAR